MSASTPKQPDYQAEDRLPYLGLLPAVLSIALIAIFCISPPSAAVFEPHYLLAILNTVFLALMPFVVAYLAGRSYVRTGSLNILLIGCALLVFGTGNLVAGWVVNRPGPNSTVTIHNLASLVASIFYVLAAIVLAADGRTTERVATRRTQKLFFTYFILLLFIALLSVTTILGLMPPFFVVGRGPTLLRKIVLAFAIILHTLSAVFAFWLYWKRRTLFLYWYSLALFLIAAGLAAIFMQPAVGSPFGWVGRISQYLGGIYFFAAVIVAVRQARTVGTSVDKVLASFFRGSEIHYRKLVETAQDAIVSTDSRGQVLLWNPAAEKVFGFARREAVGVSLSDLIGLNESLMSLLSEEGTAENPERVMEANFKRKDASMFFSEVSAWATEAADERTVTFIVRDITERKRIEEELRQSHERFRTLAEATFEGIALTEAGRFLEVNDQFVRMLGYTKHELIGTEVSLLVFPEDRSRVMENILTGRDSIIEHRAIRKDGSVIMVEAHGKPSTYEGRLVRMTALRDVTERKQAEEAIRESEKRLRFALETIHTGAWDLDLVDHSAFRSLEHDRIFGYSQLLPEWTYEMFLEHVLPEDRATVHSTFRWAMENQSDWNFECRIRRADGQVRWITAAGRHTQDAAGAPRRMAGIVQDITNRKLAEDALRQTNERLYLAQTVAKEGVWDWDILTGHIVWSEQMFDIFGLDPLKVTASFEAWRSSLHPEDAEMASRRIDNALKEKIALNSDYRVILPDGQIRWISATGKCEYDESGSPVRMIGVCMDVTERKRAEETLRASERLYRAIGESIDYGVWVCAPDGRNTYASESFLKMVGITQEQCSNFGWGDVLHPDDAERTIAAWKECIKTGAMWDIEHRFRGVDGQWHPVLARGVPVKNEHGEIVYWAGINLDISRIKEAEKALRKAHDSLELRVQERTVELSQAYETLQLEMNERAKIEDQLRQSQKMEAIGTLAGGVAHDFNNILAAILGFTEMAIDDVPDRPLVEKNLQNVLKSAMRAKDLVRQILTFSRKTSHAKSPLSVSPLIKETLQFLRASIPSTIEIKLGLSASSDTILAAPIEVQQIFMNLATNASLAMQEKGGIMEISLTDIDFKPDSPVLESDVMPGEYIQLVVKDTGIGMSPDVMKRVFEPFFTTREVGKGTGMGLAVVYGIVKDLQGTITVESEPGVGSTFRVSLPKIKAEVKEEQVKTAQVPRGKERILFVDDEDMLVEWGQAVLERLGYSVTAVTDSTGALKTFSADPSRFDLVITDQTMPLMTGVELCKELLKIRPDIPVILCTGHSENVSAETAEEVGIRQFLMKPLIKQELAEAVRRGLDERKSA